MTHLEPFHSNPPQVILPRQLDREEFAIFLDFCKRRCSPESAIEATFILFKWCDGGCTFLTGFIIRVENFLENL